jgi:hypothetical protein
VGKKSSKDSIPVLEPKPFISMQDASEFTGKHFSADQLRVYGADGSIPGARQVGKGKQWFFKRELFEKWWHEFNADRPGEN